MHPMATITPTPATNACPEHGHRAPACTRTRARRRKWSPRRVQLLALRSRRRHLWAGDAPATWHSAFSSRRRGGGSSAGKPECAPTILARRFARVEERSRAGMRRVGGNDASPTHGMGNPTSARDGNAHDATATEEQV
ncbi:hypothetical protein RJ55_02930 [Drechmeria coniospora]|nr:hypothetical protein RJ55_02930 [Drechmeria coniospora]